MKIDKLIENEGWKTFTLSEKTGEKKVFEVCFVCFLNVSLYTCYKSHNFIQQVIHNIFNNDVECLCKMFLRIGILCKHIMLVFNHGDIVKIPRKYVITRWLKNAEQVPSTFAKKNVSPYSDINDSSHSILTDVWFQFQSCISMAGLDKDKLELIQKQMKELNCSLRGIVDMRSNKSKTDMIEALVGSRPVDKVVIQVPHESRNKGCGKRLLSSAEKSMNLQKKSLRTCKLCGILCNHDSRNCPLKK